MSLDTTLDVPPGPGGARRHIPPDTAGSIRWHTTGLSARGSGGAQADARERVVRCRGLSYRAEGQAVVDGVSFDIHAGEAFGLFGSDAPARSAIVAMVCGLLESGTGSVHLLGTPVERIEPADLPATVGYVARSSVLLSSGTIGENLSLWARIGDLPDSEHQLRIAGALAQVGLTTRRDDPVARCTTGTLRELSVAVALLHRPRVLVLDEPGTGLTPRGRTRLGATLAGLRDSGVALLCSGAAASDFPGLCRSAARLENGLLTLDPAA
ncbi:ATP-binding cassette domain-containing protein [Actinoplanes couchii]|uniref:ABC transporter domain-containing protein n=1 Tax=Actinoplanes couchii TaxID=403638 RepID=A0ABQ3X1U2_9ACTN|nr:ATP-binding cassette domain-containing protein [Actinoplanes couchii]MDR6316875.1 ABC-type multidrug transport system ATPase subunit [Actinoplanes couchii]GID52482.1 hypothetical protein Aco03nite_008860 [Actinoplanes couchii]